MSGRLTEGFREITDLRWSAFVELEQSSQASNFDAVVTSIARAASKSNLRAIQAGLDRLDGKVATEIEVEYPKFYTLYPRATKTADDASIIAISPTGVVEHTADDGAHTMSVPIGVPTEFRDAKGAVVDLQAKADEELEELPTGSIRAVLDRMLDSPKQTVIDILATAELVDGGDTDHGDPFVKSVIVAGLMKLVHEGKMSAVFEVFDQIDGKVAESYKMLGDDVFMQNYAAIAPAGAVKNENGIYQIEADNTTNAWVLRLEEKNNAKKIR